MDSKKIENIIQTNITLLVALLTTAIAIAIFIHVQYGSDTITVLLDGVHVALNISIGLASILVNSLFLVLACIVAKQNVKYTTVLFTFLLGIVLDFVNPYVGKIVHPNGQLFVTCVWLCIAVLLVSFGFAILIERKFGMQSLDVLIYYINEKTGIPYVVIKISSDILFVFIGWILGGVVGLGTIVSMLFTGPCIRIWLKVFKIIQKKGIEENENRS